MVIRPTRDLLSSVSSLETFVHKYTPRDCVDHNESIMAIPVMGSFFAVASGGQEAGS